MLTRGLVKYPIFAAVVAIFLALFPWLDWLSGIVIAIMVLGDAIIPSVVTLLLISILETWHYDFQWSSGAFADQLGFYLMWASAMVLRNDWHWDRLVNGLMGLGLAAIILLHALVPNLLGFWEAKLASSIAELNQQVSSVLIFASIIPDGAWLTKTWSYLAGLMQSQMGIKLLAIVATSLWIASVTFSSLFNLGLARWWQHKVMGVGNLHDELMAFRLHRAFGVIMLLLVVLYWRKPDWYWSLDALLWMTIVTLTAGVLYCYWQIARWPLPWIWGVLAFIGLLVFPLIGLILLSGLGTFDSLINLRRFQE